MFGPPKIYKNNQLTEYSSQMPLQRLQYGHLDLLDSLSKELFTGCREEFIFVHDLTLSDSGDGQRDTLGRLHVLAHRVQCHNLKFTQKQMVKYNGYNFERIQTIHPRGWSARAK